MRAIKLCLTVFCIFGSLAFSVVKANVKANPVVEELTAVTFHGAHCRNLSTKDVEVDSRGRLYINLTKMEASRSVFEKKTCMIKIPY